MHTHPQILCPEGSFNSAQGIGTGRVAPRLRRNSALSIGRGGEFGGSDASMVLYDVFPKHIAEALMAGRKVRSLQSIEVKTRLCHIQYIAYCALSYPFAGSYRLHNNGWITSLSSCLRRLPQIGHIVLPFLPDCTHSLALSLPPLPCVYFHYVLWVTLRNCCFIRWSPSIGMRSQFSFQILQDSQSSAGNLWTA